MIEDVRKYLRAGMDALSAQAPGQVADRVQGMADQLTALAAGLAHWSAEARASLVREVKDVVARQVQELGLVTRQELDLVRARLERLEGASAEAPPRKRAAESRKQATSKKATAKKASPRNASRKQGTPRKGTARQGTRKAAPSSRA